MFTHGEVADFVGDVLDGVGDDHHAHVDQVGGGHLEHAGRKLRDIENSGFKIHPY